MASGVFDLTPAIDLAETIGDTVPSENVTCMEGCGNNLFLGMSSGRILSFSVVEKTDAKSGRLEVRADLWILQQLPSKLAVNVLRSASALNMLLALSGGTLFYLRLEDLSGIGATTWNNISCFALNSNPTTNDPFTLQLAIGSQKKAIFLCEKQVDSEKLRVVRKLNVDGGSPSCVVYDGHCLCYSTHDHYFVYNIETDAHQSLFPIDAERVVPLVERIGSAEFVLNGMQGLGVFATGDGVSSRPPVLWGTNDVFSITYSYPYIVALTDQFIAVYSVIDQQLKQRLPFSEGRCAGNFDGQIFIATKTEVYRMLAVSWDKQVESLLERDLISDALSVAQTSINRIGYDEDQLLMYRRLCQKAAFRLFDQGEQDRAVDLMIQSELDPREMISLYEGLLPSESTFVRSTPPLHLLPDLLVGSVEIDKDRIETSLWRFLTQAKTEPWARPHMKEIDTALLKLQSKRSSESTTDYEKLLVQPNNEADLDDCLQWLREHGRHHCRALLLLLSFNKPIDAFDIWRQLAQGKVYDHQYPGISDSIRRLHRLTDERILRSVARWMLDLDAESTIKAVLACDCVRDCVEMARVLETHSMALLTYLEIIVLSRECEIGQLHSRLALLYIELINQYTEKVKLEASAVSDLNDFHKRFRRFLSRSNIYNNEKVLYEMEGLSQFLSEKAFILGKTGSYDEALRVLVDDLNDLDAAQDFCSEMGATLGRNDKRRLYFSLLETYVSRRREKSIPTGRILSLLNSSDIDVDLDETLGILPSEWTFQSVNNFLLRSVRQVRSRRTDTKIANNLAGALLERLKRQHVQKSSNFVKVDEKTRCSVCRDIFTDTDVCYYPTGTVVHKDCLRNPKLCPATNTLLMSCDQS